MYKNRSTRRATSPCTSIYTKCDVPPLCSFRRERIRVVDSRSFGFGGLQFYIFIMHAHLSKLLRKVRVIKNVGTWFVASHCTPIAQSRKTTSMFDDSFRNLREWIFFRLRILIYYLLRFDMSSLRINKLLMFFFSFQTNRFLELFVTCFYSVYGLDSFSRSLSLFVNWYWKHVM